jgi:hypothetical protein
VNPRLLSLGIVLPVLLKLHLTIAAGGLAVTVFLPAFIVGALVVAAAFLTWMCVRSLRGFRSSPYLRTVT